MFLPLIKVRDRAQELEEAAAALKGRILEPYFWDEFLTRAQDALDNLKEATEEARAFVDGLAQKEAA
jgi:hypothetical protein